MLSPAALTPDSGLLHRLKLSALVLALVGVAIALAQVALSADAAVLSRTAALAAALVLVVRWIHGYRRRAFGLVSEAVEAVALLTILSVAPDAPVLLLGLVFRALYDGRRIAAVRTLAAVALLVAGAALHGTAADAGQVLGLALGAALAQGLRAAVLQAARHERLLNALIEQSTDVTAIVGEDLCVRWISGSPQGVLGASPDWVKGRAIADLLTPDQADGAVALARELATEPGASRTIVLSLPDVHGEEHWVEAVVANHLDEPNIDGFLVNLRDRTEHRRLERERVELARLRDRVEADRQRTELETRLQRSERLGSVGQLAGGIAHDFNNLLGIILNYAGFVREGLPEGDSRRDDLAEIEAAATRGARLTRQLLVFSRRGRTQPELLDVNAAIGGLERLLLASVSSRVDLRLEPGDGLPEVEIDPANLEQVLVNLVINARDALDGEGRIAVRTERVRVSGIEATDLEVVPGDYVRLTVQDDGPGMDAETRRRAVEPFFTTKANGEGTGLGLATVFGIAHGAGGGLRIDSAPGQGTTVGLYLPAVGSEPPRTVAAPGSAAPADAAAPDARRRRILVAEDEPSVRALVQRVLANAGYDVDLAVNGDEAYAMVERTETPFDLVLTDVVMPGMTGLELAARLRERDPRQRLLLMSGYSEDLLSDGATIETVLPKPFTAEVLRTAVARALAAAPFPVRG